jgi:hypothetical protein
LLQKPTHHSVSTCVFFDLLLLIVSASQLLLITLHRMAPPFNPYKQKACSLPPTSTTALQNPYKQQHPRSFQPPPSGALPNSYKQQQSRLVSPPPFRALPNPYKQQKNSSPPPTSNPCSTVQKEPLKRPPLSPLRGSLHNQSLLPPGQSPRALPNKKRRSIKHQPPAASILRKEDSIFVDCCDTSSDDHDVSNNNGQSVLISVFKVFASGLHCSVCDKPVGSGLETIRHHMKAAHPIQLPDIGKFAKFHASLLSAMNQLLQSRPCLPAEMRLKCLGCNKSYGLQHNFNKHIRVSSGHCEGSVPIRTPYSKLPGGGFVETKASETTPSVLSRSDPINACYNSSNNNLIAPRPFKTIETTISKYIRDDKDCDTFVSLLGPLIEPSSSFESTMCGYIDRYNTPLAKHEHSLQVVLSLGKQWLFYRARHEVSLIPGNYRASLLQFEVQDMGEVSQNLTYNF